jgi:hypothetical protein
MISSRTCGGQEEEEEAGHQVEVVAARRLEDNLVRHIGDEDGPGLDRAQCSAVQCRYGCR